MTERIVLRNEGMSTISFPVEIALAADFADILSVKSYDFSFGDPAQAALLPAERRPESVALDVMRIADDDGYVTLVAFSEPPLPTPQGGVTSYTLKPHCRWELTLRVSFPAAAGGASLPVAGFGTASSTCARRCSGGASACRASPREPLTSGGRTNGRSPISPRCGFEAATASACCPPPACPGS